MKRIAAHIGLTAFCALAVAFYLSETAVFILMLSCAAAAILFLLIRKTRKTGFLPVIAVTAALSCGLHLVYTALAVKPVVDQYCGSKQQIEATLTEEPYRQYAKYCYPLTTDSINGDGVRAKVLLKTIVPIDIEPFDQIRFRADISPNENPHYLAKGYFLSVSTAELDCTVTSAVSKPFYSHVIRLRNAMRDAVDDFLPKDEANLCKAVLVGDKYALDQSVKEEFRFSGGSYLIVVSGMHFSVIIWLTLWLFKRIFRKRFLYFPLTFAVIILYMLITGLQPSVVRSGVMMIIYVAGLMLRRQADPLTSLGIAGLVMPVVFSPFGCGDIGMILSFAATFSIIMWQTPIYNKLRIKKTAAHKVTRWLIKGLNAVIAVLSASLAVNILILPLSVFVFGGFSPVTVLTAVLLYPLILMTLVLSVIVCVLYYLGPLRYAALAISWPLYGAAKLTLWLVHAISSIPHAYIRVRSLYFYIWLAVTLILAFPAYLLRKRVRLYPYIALLSAVVFFGGFAVNTVVRLNTDVLEYDSGKKGAAVYLNHSGRLHMLRFDCDSGSAYRMLSRLSDDFGGAYSAVCTSNAERVNYSRYTDREFPIVHRLVYSGLADLPDEETESILPAGRSAVMLDDGVVLNTVANEGKMLLYLVDGEKTVMLIPSGYSFDAIPDDMRRADIIILNQAGKNYNRLSCNTLIICASIDDKEELLLPKSVSRCSPSDQHVAFRLN